MLLLSSVLLLGEFKLEEELDFGDGPRRLWKLRFSFRALVENHLKDLEESLSWGVAILDL